MEKKDKLYRDTIEAKSEATLIYVGKKIAEKNMLEYECIENEESDIQMPQEVRNNIENIIKEEKKHINRKLYTHWIKKISIAACLTICISLCLGAVLITNVEAFRYKFENFLTEIGQNDIKLIPNAEDEGKPIGIPKSWYGILYPEYLPEEFQFDFAIERDDVKTIIFKDNNEKTIKFSQTLAEGTQIYLDNEGEQNGTLKIKEQYDGYWVKNGDEIVLTWIQSDLIIELKSELEIDEIKKIADNLKYF